jgi:hypothetical protein
MQYQKCPSCGEVISTNRGRLTNHYTSNSEQCPGSGSSFKKSGPHIGMKTPWGKADDVKQIAEGLFFVSTPSHGGFKLTPSLNAKMPTKIRAEGGWYEEDLAYFWVVAVFPELIAHGLVKCTLEDAHRSLREWFPDEYEAVFGEPVQPSQSHKRREQIFAREHGNDWIAVAAWGSWHKDIPEGMVGVCCQPARLQRQRNAPCRYFIVPSEDYDSPELKSPLGFICEPSPSPNAPYQEVSKIT